MWNRPNADENDDVPCAPKYTNNSSPESEVCPVERVVNIIIEVTGMRMRS